MEYNLTANLSTETLTTEAVSPAPLRVYATKPVTLARRRRGYACALSLAVHGGILALALWGLGHEVIRPTPTVRLVFVAPPPPPLGVPEGKGVAPVVETPLLLKVKKVEKSRPVAKPKPKVQKRVVVPKPVVKVKELKSDPPVVVAPPAAALVEEPQAGVATGVIGGEASGVTDGAEGGIRGGEVDGKIAAPLRADQITHPPVVLSRMEPEYPEMARLREIEGQVLLEAIVDQEGHIEPEIKILKSIALLNTAAIDALKQWRFTPGRDANGQAVRVILEVPIRFVLE